MKKAIIFILINLFCLVMAQNVLTLKNGQTYEGTLVEITDTSILFKAKGMMSAQAITIEMVESVKTPNGEILYEPENVPLNYEESEESETSGYNPCDDEKYLQIKDKTLNEMSDREYNYFLSVDKECKQYLTKAITTTTKNTKILKRDSDTEILTYLALKKDPGTAGLLSFLIPTAGHAYAGDWGRGVTFFLLKFVAYYIMIDGIKEKTETIDVYFGPDITNTYLEYTSQYKLGVGALVVLYISDIGDAVNTAKKYNAKLQESTKVYKPPN